MFLMCSWSAPEGARFDFCQWKTETHRALEQTAGLLDFQIIKESYAHHKKADPTSSVWIYHKRTI